MSKPRASKQPGRPRVTKRAARMLNKPLPTTPRNEKVMNPNESLNAVAAALANGPDAALAQHLVAGLRVLIARNVKATPSAAVRVRASREPEADDRGVDALAAEAADLDRSVRRALETGDFDVARANGARLASIQRRLADRQAAEAANATA